MKKDIEWYEAYWQRLAENPTVADLVGFRKESEEIEVTALESIREEIWEEMLRLEDKRKERWADIRYITLREVLQKLGHLDEPEVLSQDWIDRNKEPFHHFENNKVDYYVSTDSLQSLLVPKQEEMVNYTKGWTDGIAAYVEDLNSGENLAVVEKPIIPDFVANYIKWFKNDFEHNFAADIDFIISLIQVSHKFSRREKIKNWISKSGNAQKLLDAYRWGYEVEEEQKYFVSSRESVGFWFLSKNNDNEVVIGTNKDYYDRRWESLKLTEQEIKDYDSRYWAFAVKVEEMEK